MHVFYRNWWSWVIYACLVSIGIAIFLIPVVWVFAWLTNYPVTDVVKDVALYYYKWILLIILAILLGASLVIQALATIRYLFLWVFSGRGKLVATDSVPSPVRSQFLNPRLSKYYKGSAFDFSQSASHYWLSDEEKDNFIYVNYIIGQKIQEHQEVEALVKQQEHMVRVLSNDASPRYQQLCQELADNQENLEQLHLQIENAVAHRDYLKNLPSERWHRETIGSTISH